MSSYKAPSFMSACSKKGLLLVPLLDLRFGCCPSSIYSWSISHNLEHEFFYLGRLGSSGSKEKKSGFELFWATFEVGFFNFLWEKKIKTFWKHCSDRTEKLHRKKVFSFFADATIFFCPWKVEKTTLKCSLFLTALSSPNGPNRRINDPKCGL